MEVLDVDLGVPARFEDIEASRGSGDTRLDVAAAEELDGVVDGQCSKADLAVVEDDALVEDPAARGGDDAV